MKRAFKLLLIALCMSCATILNGQTWQWAKFSNSSEEAYYITVDGLGNSYLFGSALSTMVFGNDSIAAQEMYVAKYDSLGNVKWARSINSVPLWSGIPLESTIALDGQNNLYITGRFQYDAYFENDSLFSNGMASFIEKLDSSGNKIWVKKIETDSKPIIALSAESDIYFLNSFKDSVTVDNISLIDSSGKSNILIAKFDSAGNIFWAKNVAKSTQILPRTVSVDNLGNIVIGGNFYGDTADFDNVVLMDNTPGLCNNIFIAKYDSSGQLQWAKSPGVSGNILVYPSMTSFGQNEIYSLTTDSSSNIYVTGCFLEDNLVFDSISIANNVAGKADFFLAKYDTSGNIVWVKSGGGTESEAGYCAKIDKYNNVWVSGGFTSSIAYFANDSIFGTLYSDPMFLANYSPAGALNYVSALSSGGDDESGIALDMSGNLFLVGDYRALFDFVVGNDTGYANTNLNEIPFVAKMGVPYNLSLNVDTTTVVPFEVSGSLSNVFIYPNPAQNQFTICYTGNPDNNAHMLLYNVIGQEILSSDIVTKYTHVSTATLPAGMYTCKITSGGQTCIRKVIIEN